MSVSLSHAVMHCILKLIVFVLMCYCENASSAVTFLEVVHCSFDHLNTLEEFSNIYKNFIEKFLASFSVMTKRPLQL